MASPNMTNPNKEENKIVAHFKRHKGKYITGVVCFALGITAGVIFKRYNVTITGDGNIFSGKNTVITELVRRGHPGNAIRCIETGEIFASQNRCAEVLGLSRTSLYKYFKGLVNNVNGLTFENLGDIW